MRSSRTLLLVGIAAVALALGLSAGRALQAPAPRALIGVTRLPAPRALPRLALDGGAAALTTADLAGRWSVLFFGYTRCPDVCPTTLALLAKVVRRLADQPTARRPRVVFVSVDPARDPAARVAEYARWFDAGFSGVTGSDADLAVLTAALGAPFARGTPDPTGAYAVDHSGALFILDPAVRFAAVMTPPLDAATLEHDLRVLLDEGP